MSHTRISTTTHSSSLIVASMILAIVAFGYRFVSLTGFSNDHYVHLARAQAMLAGDLPIRDYTEEGVPLTVVLSATVQRVLGESLFAEVVLVLTSIAVGAGITCWLASRVTGSLLIGASAALLQVVIYPRLYSHPKIMVYSVFLAIAWWYVSYPSRVRLAVVALWTAVAFLIRHDHGVYVGAGAAALIASTHVRNGIGDVARRAIEFGVLTLACLTPYLGYVQYQQGLINYFRTGLATSGTEAKRTRLGRLTFDALPDGGWVVSRPIDPAGFPSIRVRWKPEVDDRRRESIEGELQLRAPEHAEGRTWKYRLEPPAREALSQLVSRREVEDTSGFDRSARTLPDDRSLVSRILAALGLDRLARLDAGPRLISAFSPHNVSVTLFFVLWSIPLLAITLVAIFRNGAITREHAFTLTASALMIVCAAGLLRESLAERIADVYGSAPLVLACLIAVAWHARPRQRLARWTMRGAVAVIAIVFVAGTFMLGRVPSQLNRARLADGPGAVWQRARAVFHDTRQWPWVSQWPAGSSWKVARYVHDCTRSGDRLLMTWSAPEMNVFSRRPFAGGETALLPVFRDPSSYEPAVLARLSRQSVPIVLVDPDELEHFRQSYPAISKYLDTRFHKVGEFTPDPRKIHIYAEINRQPAGTDAEFGWPCFAPQTAGSRSLAPAFDRGAGLAIDLTPANRLALVVRLLAFG
jgi:hypothetical protein